MMELGSLSNFLSPPTSEPRCPKPNMVVIPIREITLGADMTIQCQTHHRNVRFFLYKDGYPTLWQPIQPAGVVAVFLIHCVRQDDGGNYICVYHRILEPGIRSYPSDPMELLVRGEELSVPTPCLNHRLALTGAAC